MKINMSSYFLIPVFTVSEKPALQYEKNQIFDKLLTVLLHLILLFSEVGVRKCSTK